MESNYYHLVCIDYGLVDNRLHLQHSHLGVGTILSTCGSDALNMVYEEKQKLEANQCCRYDIRLLHRRIEDNEWAKQGNQ